MKESKSRSRFLVGAVILVLLLVFFLIIKNVFFDLEGSEDNSYSLSEATESELPGDDSEWLPDAIVESEDQILEMKFGF